MRQADKQNVFQLFTFNTKGGKKRAIAIISLVSGLGFNMTERFHALCPKEKAIKKIILYAIYARMSPY